MSNEPGKTAIVGAVGSDPTRKVLETLLNSSGVQCLYQEIPEKFTGCGVILIVDNNRSIVASVAASAEFDFTRWDTPEVLGCLSKAKVVLVSVYFLRSSDRTGLAVGAECAYRGIPLALALASSSAVESEAWPSLHTLLRVSTIVFGNQSEILVLAKKLGLVHEEVPEDSADYRKLCKKIAKCECGLGRRRIVICTLGDKPTVGYDTDKGCIVRPIIPIDPVEIVDTNGAGDSFAGGFLAWFIRGASIEKCIDAGHYAANANLRNRGCSVPCFRPDFE
jgi:adenosine kinase